MPPGSTQRLSVTSRAITRRWSATVTASGSLMYSDPGRFAGHLARLRGKRVIVTVSAETPTRNLSQNSYLWVIYSAIAEWSGHESEEIHGAMKEKFLPRTSFEVPSGVELQSEPTTTTLTVSQFSEYVDKVKRWALEQGLFIPDRSELEER